MQLKFVDAAEAPALADFARPIWQEVFAPILPGGAAEAAFLDGKWQSAAAIAQDQADGIRYGYVLIDGRQAGYFAARLEGVSLFLSKIYLTAEYRGRGLGSELIQELLAYGRKNGMRRAYLHVNVNNARAVAAYERNGFRTIAHEVTPVGEGYEADDFIMARAI